MAFIRAHFVRHRPYLYHFTDSANEYFLVRERSMHSAAEWARRANAYNVQIADMERFLTTPREKPRKLEVDEGLSVTLNDQKPLLYRDRFAALHGTFEEYIRFLNGLVFFWPGTDDGPKPKGKLAATFETRY